MRLLLHACVEKSVPEHVSEETLALEQIDSNDVYLQKAISDLRRDLDSIGIDVSQVPPESLIEISLWLVSSMATDPEDRIHPAFESFIVESLESLLDADQLAGLTCVTCSGRSETMVPIQGVASSASSHLLHCRGCKPTSITALKTAQRIARVR